MLLSILAYLALLIFLIGVLYRIIRIYSTPIHLRWELYPVPHEVGKKAKYGGSYLEEVDWWTKPLHGSRLRELSIMIPEIFFLKGVWESNRGLWFWSWAFHFGLYALILMFVLAVVSVIIGPATVIGGIVNILTIIAGAVAYVLGTIGCLGMIVKRTVDSKMKDFTSAAAIFNLLFILAIFITGIIAVLGASPTGLLTQIQYFIKNLVIYDGGSRLNPAISVHLIVILLFAMYMPFTHMAHFILKYFTYHTVRWNDEPNLKGSAIEKQVDKVLNYKPTWAAEHIKGDGKKTWVDVATEEIFKDEKEN